MEIKIIQRLCHMMANTDEDTRRKALRSLKKLFSTKSGVFDELTMKKITKSLYYAIWMTDKPLKLRVVCVTIVQLHSVMTCKDNVYLFFKSLFKSLANEWHLLDKNRMDKILLFVRILTSELLFFLNDNSWDLDSIKSINEIILDSDGIFSKRCAGLGFQFLRIYIEEFNNNKDELLQRNKFTEPTELQLLVLMTPFIKIASSLDNRHILNVLHTYIFRKLASSVENYSHVMYVLQLLNKTKIPSNNRKLIKQTLNLFNNTGVKVSNPSKTIKKEIDAILRDIEAGVKILDSYKDINNVNSLVTNLQNYSSEEEDNVTYKKAEGESLTSSEVVSRNISERYPNDFSEVNSLVNVKGINKKAKREITRGKLIFGEEDVIIASPPKKRQKTSSIDDGLLCNIENALSFSGENESFADSLLPQGEFLTLSQISGISNRGLKLWMSNIAVLNRAKVHLIASKVNDKTGKEFLERLKRPSISNQLTFYGIYILKRLKMMHKFKCSKRLYKIFDFNKLNSTRRRNDINIQKAIDNIKNEVC